MEKDKHITILAILNIVRGALLLLIGAIAFVFFAGIGTITGDSTAMGVLGLIGLLAAIFMGILAIPSILAGVGLLQRQEWGRILALVVGIISLIDVPIGTALGIYSIWLLMDDGTRTLFNGNARVQPLTVQQAPTS